MLYLIGLGLGDEKDVTVRGLEVIKQCRKVYLEAYTSILGVGKERLEEFYGREVIIADREMVESESESIMEEAKDADVAFLVVGDAFGATTHSDFVIRAVELGIKYQVIHNASIMNACGCCGLQLYRFGQCVSIVFFAENWRPDSFYDRIASNRKDGLHTLCLLDIKVKEPNLEMMGQGKIRYDPPRYLTINQSIDQLLEVETKRATAGGGGAYGPDTMAVGLARVGQQDQCIIAGTLAELKDSDFGGPLHSLIIVGELHDMEETMLDLYRPKK